MQESEYESTVVIYISTIIVQVHCYHKMWYNIVWILHHQETLKNEIQWDIYEWIVQKEAHELQQENSRAEQGDLEGYGLRLVYR